MCTIPDMVHSCQYLCSELVTVTYEEQPGEIRQTTANLEEISTDLRRGVAGGEAELRLSLSRCLSKAVICLA